MRNRRSQPGDPLTERQAAVLKAVTGYWAEHGRSPTIHDLWGACGTVSNNGVECHLKAMEKKGVVEVLRGKTARGIYPAGLRDGIRRLAAALTDAA